VAGLEGAEDVPQCPAPTGGKGGNGEGQTGGKAGVLRQRRVLRIVLRWREQ
jgi:hypothetical protein